MAKAIITLEDTDDGQVNISFDFGAGGMQNESCAHHYAVDALELLTERIFGEPVL